MNAARRSDPWSHVRLVVPVTVLVGAMLLLPIDDIRPGGQALSYAGTGATQGALDLLAGQMLLLAGVMAWIAGLPGHVGMLAVVAGVAWFGPDLFALRDADDVFRALGRFVLSPLLLPLLLHLALASLGMDRGRRAGAAIACAYAITAIVAAGALVTFDAGAEVHCMDYCAWQNPFLLWWHVGVIRTWQVAGALVMGGIAMVVGLVALRALRRPMRPSPGRWAAGPSRSGCSVSRRAKRCAPPR